MKRKLVLITVFASLLFTLEHAWSQSLDRIAISSGGAATDNCNYIIGESFCFSASSNGDVFIEIGSLGSDDNTGGLLPEFVKEMADNDSQIICYPNPAKHILTVKTNNVEKASDLVIFNELGKIIMRSKPNIAKTYLNVQSLSSGWYYVVALNGKKILGINKFVKQ